jgi:hypothetical protein
MTTSNENTSGAINVSANTWKTNDGVIFTTPSYDPPIYYTPITIYDKEGSTSGRFINGEAIKDKAGS